ncbi:MAG: MBL fold metallo-hydrolase [Ottowia sp.]|nr:MBL fold metallo-hydrolase [Ottowia sp.]
MSLADALEAQLDYPWADQVPAAGTSVALAPGVKWIRMSLPFALDHINLWLLRDSWRGREGWTVVDCGVDRADSRADWETVFANELDGLPVLRVIVTHFHPDHIGLAHWLCARWEAPLWISATDYHAALYACTVANNFGGAELANYFASHGMADPGDLQQVRERKFYYTGLVPRVPGTFVRLMDQMMLQMGTHGWRCIVGYGHAPEHMSLYCDELNLLIGGDMMLPRISTNVSVYLTEPEADPLTLFLDSISRFRALPADTLVLPSHGKPFRGLHTRIGQLEEHHRLRLDDVMQAARKAPVSAHDMLPVLFKRKLDLHQTTFALGESVAHLHRLWHSGQLVRERDADGIWRFAAV